jgi:hypothetical protein
MATAPPPATRAVKEYLFDWEGKDRNGRVVRGEMRAGGEAVVNASLRRQGIFITRLRKRRLSGGSRVSQKEIAIFTRQLAAMMKAGVPLLQAFEAPLECGQLGVGPRVLRGAVPEGAEGDALDVHPDEVADQHRVLAGEFREPKDRIDVVGGARRVAGGHPRRSARPQRIGHGFVEV